MLKCSECNEMERRTGKPPSCERCRMPQLLPENYEPYAIARRAIHGALDGMGGINYQAIDISLRAFGLRPGAGAYGEAFEKVRLYVLAYAEKRREEHDRGK